MTDTLPPGRGDVAARLAALGVALPYPTISPHAKIEPYVLVGGWLYVSGQIPQWAGTYRYIGKLGDTLGLQDGYDAARLCAINVLSCVHLALDGEFDRIERLVKVTGFGNATPGFTDLPKVVNGASEFFIDVLGDRGRHARSAVGAAVMPFGVAIEIEATFLVR